MKALDGRVNRADSGMIHVRDLVNFVGKSFIKWNLNNYKRKYSIKVRKYLLPAVIVVENIVIKTTVVEGGAWSGYILRPRLNNVRVYTQ